MQPARSNRTVAVAAALVVVESAGGVFVPRITKRYYLALDRRRRVCSDVGAIEGNERERERGRIGENILVRALAYVCTCVRASALQRGQVTTKH